MKHIFKSSEELLEKLSSVMAAALLIVGMNACQPSTEVKEQPPLTGEALIKRGEYLINAGACGDCHSPKIMTETGPIPDPDRLLSGHPKDEILPPIVNTSDWILFSTGVTSFVGPWGQSFAANLTPHATGIGNWTFEHFKTAIRKGKYKGLEGSRNLVPPMPWQFYSHISDDDLYALFAYLKSIKPVDNQVPAYISPENLSLNTAQNAE
jgi:hypothetical protein